IGVAMLRFEQLVFLTLLILVHHRFLNALFSGTGCECQASTAAEPDPLPNSIRSVCASLRPATLICINRR
ncbi:hypothetical protein, partial [Ramlibacter sp.]|uniref:hypothetical protein n=1 Tax=Ramlibacter sp. TaxID=1917967 RepID=UPI002FCC361F